MTRNITILLMLSASTLFAEDVPKKAVAKPFETPKVEATKGEVPLAAETTPKLETKADVIPAVPAAKPRAEVVKVDKRRDRVSVTDDPAHLWNKKDNVCIYRTSRPMACGKVIAVGIKGAVVQLNPHAAAVHAGDEARYFEPEKKMPDITDDQISSEGIMDTKPYTFTLALGYILSLDLKYPIAHFYWAVSPTIAIGIQPAYITHAGETADAKISGYGGLLSANYFSEEYFRGLWVQGATGFYRLTAVEAGYTETLNVPAVHAVVGWREDWAHGLNVGAGLGGRFLSPLSGLATNVKYSTFHAIAQVELGYSF